MAPWIDELENQQWIIEHSEEILAFYGEEPFWADEPVPLKGQWESLHQSDPEAAAQAVAESWVTELGLPFEGVTVASMEEPGIFFDVQEGEIQIDLNEFDLKQPQTMLAVLSLAIAGIFISMKRPDSGQGWHEDEEMPITTLIAILLGFGPYICLAQWNSENSSNNSDNSENPGNSEKSDNLKNSEKAPAFDSGMSHLECCFAQAYVCFIFEQDFTSFQNRFDANSREPVADALSYLMQMEAQQQ
ncbi:MAG TPA: hypothetical protein DEA96_00105 [Leptospiraceae bacterium]|nr:hypothetical protein [Leptospiraceae bacterium]